MVNIVNTYYKGHPTYCSTEAILCESGLIKHFKVLLMVIFDHLSTCLSVYELYQNLIFYLNPLDRLFIVKEDNV